MKKRSILSKLMVTAMAMALVLGSGASTLTVHATDDGCYHGNGRENGGGGDVDWGSSDSGSSSSSSSSDSSSSSSNSGSDYYDDGAYHGNGRENGGGGDVDWGSSNSGNDGGGSTYTAPSGLATKGNTVTIPGCETFRQINKPADGRVAIYHCGIEQYTAQLTGADGKAVAYASAGAYKDEATGKWYLNIVTADGVDTTGYTVGTWKGDVTYLAKLGMSGVALNGVAVVDATAAK